MLLGKRDSLVFYAKHICFSLTHAGSELPVFTLCIVPLMCCIRLFTCNVYICKLCLNVVLFSMVYMLAWDIVLWIFTNWICQQTCLTNCFAHGMIISADLIFKWKRWAEVSCGMWSQRVPWYCSDIFGATGVRMLNDAIEVPWEVLWSFRLDEYSEEEDTDPRPRRSSRVFWFEHCYTDVWTHSKGFSRTLASTYRERCKNGCLAP